MADGHITAEVWQQFKERRLSPESFIYLLAQHVKDLCPECAEEIVRQYSESEAGSDGPSLDEQLQIAIPRTGQQFQAAVRLMERLEKLPRSDRADALRDDPEARGPAVVSVLVREAQKHVSKDASAAYVWAELAVLAARLSCLEEMDLGMLASAHHANALRALGDLQGAEAGFGPALAHLENRPAPDPMIASEIGSLYGSLLIDLRRLPDALEVLDRAFADAKSVEDSKRAGKALAQMAITHDHLGRPELAVYFGKRALSHVGFDDPLTLPIAFNLLHDLLHAGRVFEAWEEYMMYLPEFPEAWRPKLLWFEGSLAVAQGDAGTAETAFLEVRRHYRKAGDSLNVAMVCLDLSELYLEVGRESEIPELASYVLEAFAASHSYVPAHLVSAFRQLHEAAVQHQVKASTIRGLLQHVRDLRTRPQAPPTDPS